MFFFCIYSRSNPGLRKRNDALHLGRRVDLWDICTSIVKPFSLENDIRNVSPLSNLASLMTLYFEDNDVACMRQDKSDL